MPPFLDQLGQLLLLALPIASISWTVTHEEIFRECRQFCEVRMRSARSLLTRKLFFALTCEFCFSHYAAVAFLFITRFRLLYEDWRGYLIAGFALVWIANVYMSAFGRFRLEIKDQRLETELKEQAAADGGSAKKRPRQCA